MTLSQIRESAVPTERRGPGTVSRLCPDQPLTLRSTLPAVPPTSEDCTFGTSAAVLLLRCMVLHSIQALHAECQMGGVRTVALRPELLHFRGVMK